MITSKLTVTHLSLCSRIAGRCAHLPGVATPDWCEAASRTLLHCCPDSIVSVTIGEWGGDRESGKAAMCVLDTGAASEHEQVASHRVHPDTTTDLGWTLSEPAHPGRAGVHPRIAKLRELASWSRWPVSPSGKRWSKLGVREMLVADIALPGGPKGRELLVEIGSPSAMQRFDRGEPEMIAAILPVIAERAGLAFGHNFANPLTSREQLILVELVSGASVREIAERIDRSPHTVHDHVKSLHRKLNASSRGELVSRYLGFDPHSPSQIAPSAGHTEQTTRTPQVAVRKTTPASPVHSS